MEFNINNDYFNQAISEVSRVISLKTTIPILTGIKIVANSQGLTLIGSNSEIVIEKTIPIEINDVKIVEVSKPGSIVVSAKYISDLVKKLPSKIKVTVNEKQLMTIQSDEIITHINGFDSEQYPLLPLIKNENQIKIPISEMIEMIRQTVFAVSKNEARPVLTGVNMSILENKLKCVATNSHRLALKELKIDSVMNGSFIVPSASLNEVVKLFSNDSDEMNVFITEQYIVFKSELISLYSRLIEGKYPEVSGLIPKELKTKMTLDTKQLLKGFERASIFASEWKNNNVYLEILDGSKLKISSHSSEVGKIEEIQIIKNLTGQPELNISIDANYMIESLKVIKEEEVSISFSGSMKPFIIKPINNNTHLHLISPVRTY
ncbi:MULTISPECIES: DNA polymerase III subunit beta [unclassified Bacillus (in: firmicutes)]|uniref:DNA polymerase III subunit beta n=1 Tax=unclassified Bacillus (in: firmicutes) TaxID=185979 RepID=UPI000BEF38E0|nr:MULTISPECIES: DNA polymerase III subunit beta [unclassified Bacillus (in: firmicutes)]PEJ53119.1 DNA polymerase III subunit beta [Bacillus sp. AFS002410]PEL13710.1 DNA polymerase III subunit beta [Bacillus sp. AFS017336]